MTTLWILLGLAVWLVFGLFGWALCVAAGRADERSGLK
jgi:hypothetical protein